MPLPSTRKSKEATEEPWLSAPEAAASLGPPAPAAAAPAATRRGAAAGCPAGVEEKWRKGEEGGVWRARSKAVAGALRPPVGVVVRPAPAALTGPKGAPLLLPP